MKTASRDCESQGCGLHQDGRVALITGGSRGIGRAIAVRLARAGCHVVVNYFRKRKAAEEVAEEVRAAGMRALIVKANVANEDAIAEMFRQIREEFGQLDILVSNAASGVLKPALELTARHWHWTMDINAGTMIPLARHAVPLMEGRRGHIIAVSSLGAVRALPNYTAVGASKAALESLVRHLAVELAPRGVRVNAVSAGVVDTDALKHFPNRDELINTARDRTPSGRLTTPDDVADVILILCNRCTDLMVNKVTPALFAAYPDAPALSRARIQTVEKLIRSTGFYRNKALSLVVCSKAIVEQHGGEVPQTMEALTALRGVARKTANVVLGNAFGKNIGIVVDTHVKRLSGRLGFSSQSSPDKIEKDLMPLFPEKDWTLLSHLLIDHGRAVCPSRKPKCDQCVLAEICPSAES